MLEQVLMDVQKADPEWYGVLLRYFNPIGAHESGLIGENPNGIPNNLMPYITQTAISMRKELGVFGNDYDTPDCTGVRGFIHHIVPPIPVQLLPLQDCNSKWRYHQDVFP